MVCASARLHARGLKSRFARPVRAAWMLGPGRQFITRAATRQPVSRSQTGPEHPLGNPDTPRQGLPAGYPAVRRPGFLAAHPVGIARLLPAGSTACGDSQSAIIGVMDGQAPTTAGALLLLARHEAGLSQRELAERAGVTQSEIARIESGKREPSIPTIQRILAGAGLELRFRLAALEDHDRVLADRQARRSPRERGAADARHSGNLKKFAATVRQK